MNPTDKELVDSACRGDSGSFRVLYERHWPMALALATSRISDRHLAEDVAQESFVVACQRLSTLKEGKCFPSWLGTIVRRTAGAARRPNDHTLDSIAEPVAPSESLADPGEYEELQQAIDQLSGSQREVVFLRYFGGLSYQEIADVIGTSTGSVHGLLQRARNCLSQILGKLSSR